MKGYQWDGDTLDNNTDINLGFQNNSSIRKESDPQSHVFIFVDTYFPTLIKTGLKIVTSVIKFAIFSNIFEVLIYLHIFIYDRTSESEGVVSAMLSEKVRIKRQRRKTINIQMTIISWLIEFISGIAILAMYFLFNEANIVTLFAMFNTFVNFVIIPGTYILHTEVFRTFVVAQGWSLSIRRMCHPTRVSPLQDEEQNSDEHHNDVPRPQAMPQPIPTISGNISARQKRTQRQNVIIEMKTLRETL